MRGPLPRRILSGLAMLAALGVIAGPSAPAWADAAVIGVNGFTASVPVVSMKSARFKGVINQRYDFSCGSAALASLLTYQYDRPTTEAEVFKSMFSHGDQARIRRQGFSLLDMKRFLARQGVVGNGYRVTLDQFLSAHVPGIALINVKGYRHFVVVKGLRGDEVLVGDPAIGLTQMPKQKLARHWENVVFVIDHGLPKGQFAGADTWPLNRSLPFGAAIDRYGLAAFTLQIGVSFR